MAKEKDLSPETKNAQALHQIDAMTGGITPAIHPSSTFLRDENYQLINARHSYGRDENPGYAVAEKVLAELEGAAGGTVVQLRHGRGDGCRAIIAAGRSNRRAQGYVLGSA